MKTLTFSATLLSDTVISEHSATAGGHSCLDYLPGARFMGLCAGHLYESLSPDDAFTLFHSGKVRFGNAYPLSENGIPALPIPLAWHLPKGESLIQDGKINNSKIYNIIYVDDAIFLTWDSEGTQPKQIRTGYVTMCGDGILPATGYRLKTAIDRAKARAADSQLFGYEHLVAGSKWWLVVDFDDDIHVDLINRVKCTLTQEGLRIGRSRGAEYGRIELQNITDVVPVFASSSGSSDYVTIYCFSDVALRNPETGIPLVYPHGAHFGFVDVKLIADKSFIRTRTYAPFNGKRKTHDLERQVIVKGSVITYRKNTGEQFTAGEVQEIQERLSSGVGMYRHDGLGKVFINPSFLEQQHLILGNPEPLLTRATDKTGNVSSELALWLNTRVQRGIIDKEIMEQVDEWVKILHSAIKRLDEGAPYPGNSQWGTIRDIALRKESSEDLSDALFGEKGLCTHGVSEEQWKSEFRYEKAWIAFSDFLKDVVMETYKEFYVQRKALYLLSNRMPHSLNQAKGDK
jgi:CRISPR-associated protein Csx10